MNSLRTSNLSYFVGSTVVNLIGLWLLNWILHDFTIDTFWVCSAWHAHVDCVPGIALGITWPPFAPDLFVIAFALSAFFVLISPWKLNQRSVHSSAALWVVLGVTFFGTIVGGLFSLNDEDGYDRFVTDQLSKSYDKEKIVSDKPSSSSSSSTACPSTSFSARCAKVICRLSRSGWTAASMCSPAGDPILPRKRLPVRPRSAREQ